MEQTYQPKPEHFIRLMKMHYAAADFFAKNYKLNDAEKALELAEAARVEARKLGAKV